ncbi:serine protease gd-like isoform X2 [Neocloeon triangulifer]|uniref:serine protease gd-like isoform X2 n=1 Tax=Neocloeon triangulifer TaxID=2078957 RepID=UPI00286FA582|nr:serine protease gd-like isoform X2 [Neocloeon triangulifer]
MIKLLVLLLGIFRMSSAQGPRDTCPNYFAYNSDTSGGTLSIPPPQGANRVNLVVEYMVHVPLDNSYRGHLSLAEHENEINRRLQSNNRSPIKYQLKFPVRFPLPYLTKIIVNNEMLCNYVPGNVQGPSTTQKLYHDFKLESQATFSQQPQNQQFSNQQQNPAPAPAAFQYYSTTRRPVVTSVTTSAPCPQNFYTQPPKCVCSCPRIPPTPPPVQCPSVVEAEEKPQEIQKFRGCGISSSTKFLVLNGDTVTRGSYPWLSAIYETTGTGLQFVCGGTLVSKKHVLTAAHCVSKAGERYAQSTKNVIVYLGKHNIVSFTEGAVALDIKSIKNHPGYTGDALNAGVDLSVITFQTEVTFGPYIRPICLWNPVRDYRNSGQVVGWGRDGFGKVVSPIPKEAKLSVVANSICRKDPDLARIMTNTTFCAGSTENNGPCKGDSGGGLYIWSERPRKWYIRGIVSQALWDPSYNTCDLSKNVLFTDVSKTLSWITDQIVRENSLIRDDEFL